MLHIEGTRTTPLVDIQQGRIRIHGRSIPEDSADFFNPVLEACEKYAKTASRHTDILIHLDYVNSGSKKFLTNILTILEKSYLEGKSYSLTWKYDEDDEAMLDLGNDLKSIIKIPITLVSTEG